MGGRGVCVWRALSESPELREHLLSNPLPPNFLLSPAWQAVCAASRPWDRQPVRFGPPHTRPCPPPSFLPPAAAPPSPPPGLRGKFCIFPMSLAQRCLCQLRLVPAGIPSGPGGRAPGTGHHAHHRPQPAWKGQPSPGESQALSMLCSREARARAPQRACVGKGLWAPGGPVGSVRALCPRA